MSGAARCRRRHTSRRPGSYRADLAAWQSGAAWRRRSRVGFLAHSWQSPRADGQADVDLKERLAARFAHQLRLGRIAVARQVSQRHWPRGRSAVEPEGEAVARLRSDGVPDRNARGESSAKHIFLLSSRAGSKTPECSADGQVDAPWPTRRSARYPRRVHRSDNSDYQARARA